MPAVKPTGLAVTFTRAVFCVDVVPLDGVTESQLPPSLVFAATWYGTGDELLANTPTDCAGAAAPPARATKKSPSGSGAGLGGVSPGVTLRTAVTYCGLFNAPGSVSRTNA